MDEKIIVSGAGLNRTKQENCSLEAQLKSLSDKIPVIELKNRISDVNSEIEDLEKRIQKLKSSNVKVISKEEQKKVLY